MAFLFTHHDPYHVHAFLGLLVLLTFLTRIINVFIFGTAFPESESKFWACCGILSHGALPLSALLLPIPSKRNFSSPMIWPEFRLHSIVFGMRHVIATLMEVTDSWPNTLWLAILCKTALIVSVVLLAKLTSLHYGDKELRTTNAMPYPSSVTEKEQQGVKHNYRLAQFYATVHAVLGDATSAYMPLLAIQAAPFLMTLVRKNIITAIWYHRIYSLALYFPYIVLLTRLVHGTQPTAVILFVGLFVPLVVEPLRVKFQLSPEYLWPLVLPPCLFIISILKSVQVNHWFELLFAILYAVHAPFGSVVGNYKVLFLPTK